jgi:hypothetical protein
VQADTRAGRIPAREWWGYGVWFFAALVFAIPESWAGFGSPPWPTLSITIAHLETLWPGTRVVIVIFLVFLVFQALRFPLSFPGRAASGRLATRPRDVREIPAAGYLIVALAAVAGGSLIAASVSGSMYVLGYVIYGLFAIFFVAIPNVLAFWFGRDVAFPTFFRTIANLERRWRLAAVAIVAALTILLFHLVFFPWPNIPA